MTENITLKCGTCNDPIVVTITTIQIQPQFNRMIWTMTYFNNSQTDYVESFNPDSGGKFTLQLNQTDSQVPGQAYVPTGPKVHNGPTQTLPAGATAKDTITFSFIPYQGVPYSLSAVMADDFDGFQPIKFDPVTITFD